MKTKIIPFDLETAMKIQTGEIEGKMYVSDNTHNKIRIICTDRKTAFGKIVTLEENKTGAEWIVECNLKGEFLATTILSSEQYVTTRCIVLEVPDNKPQFKPFDRVLVRENDASLWKTGFYSHELDGKHFVCGNYYPQCITYEGHEHLVGRISKQKEE